MVGPKNFRSHLTLTCALAALAFTGAACGGADKADPTSTGSGAPTVEITTATGSLGTYLVDSAGRALYMYDADPEGGSECYDSCAAQWPRAAPRAPPRRAGNGHRRVRPRHRRLNVAAGELVRPWQAHAGSRCATMLAGEQHSRGRRVAGGLSPTRKPARLVGCRPDQFAAGPSRWLSA